jgi:serine/threonine protein kinase
MRKKPRLSLALAINPAPQVDLMHTKDMDEVDSEGPANLRNGIAKVHKVGEGAGGIVSLGIFVPTLKMVAIKEVSVADDEHERHTMDEVHAVHEQLVPIDSEGAPVWFFHYHQSVGDVHPCRHIVSFYGSYADRAARKVTMILEYMHGGSFDSVMKIGGLRSETLLRYISSCCLKGLAHMADHDTVHRDIKPANLLVNHDGEVKLGDLGLACHLDNGKKTLEDEEGTTSYLAPERILGKEYSFPADIWALGISLHAIATGAITHTFCMPSHTPSAPPQGHTPSNQSTMTSFRLKRLS